MASSGHRKITLAGREVNRVGLGTNRLTDTPENREFLEAAVGAGIETIDTAHLYTGGDSETTIGNALAPYEDVLVATKGGFAGGEGTSTEELRAELDQSFERLRTERIELYYVHRVNPEVPLSETMGLLAEYVEAGRLGHVGLSEVSVEQIEEARQTLPIAAVQNQFSLAERKHDAVVDHCAAEGIAFAPFFPLRTSDDGALSDVAERLGATPNQAAIAWLLRRSPAMLPIPGTLSVEHARENLAALDLELSDEDYARLSG
jgi:pyridoxine 4-dehydrogenase